MLPIVFQKKCQNLYTGLCLLLRLSKPMKKTDLTQLLKLIYYQRPISQAALAEELDLSAGYITMVVQRLREKQILIPRGS